MRPTEHMTCPFCAIQGQRRLFGSVGCTHTQTGRDAPPAPGTKRVVLLPTLGCGHCQRPLTFDENGIGADSRVRCRCDTCGYKVAVPLQVLDLPATDIEEKSI